MAKTEYDEVKANLIKKSLEKVQTDVYVPVERRKKSDGILKFINFMCFFVWIIFFIIIAVIEKAGTSILNIYTYKLLEAPAEYWNVELLRVALIMTVVCIFICTISIVLGATRHRRRTDKIKKPLIICEVVCFIIATFLSFKLR